MARRIADVVTATGRSADADASRRSAATGRRRLPWATTDGRRQVSLMRLDGVDATGYYLLSANGDLIWGERR